MPRLALAFYNGRDFGTWLDRLIARHDRGANDGPFSHVELVFEHLPGQASLCFSASYRDGGVRFKRINLEETPGKWALVRLAIESGDALCLRAWCRRQLGGRYDIPGVLAFKLPWVRHRLNWWFCSEICTAALQRVGVLGGIKPQLLGFRRGKRSRGLLAQVGTAADQRCHDER